MRKKISQFFESRESLKQFIQFCLVGGSNFLIMSLTYWAFIYLLNTDEFVALTAGFITSVFNAYYWNLVWVFKHKKGNKKKALVKFIIIYTSTYFFSLLLTFIFVRLLNGDKFFAPFINTAVTTPINFFLSKFWAFKSVKVGAKV